MRLVPPHPRADQLAAEYGVSAKLHSEDFIYRFHLDTATKEEAALNAYFPSGDYSAKRLDALITRLHVHRDRKLSLLEFASGYGCVSRHLRKLDDRYDLVACDIHEAAVEFLEQELGIPAIQSAANPDHLDVRSQYDVVFALSFFSHMPHTSWGRWVRKLFSLVADGGLLIFTAHGRVGRKSVGEPALEPEGYWFAPVSEQQDLPTAEYGTMITTPYYVFGNLEPDGLTKPIFYEEAFWWGTQDTYVVQKAEPAQQPRSALMAPPQMRPVAPRLPTLPRPLRLPEPPHPDASLDDLLRALEADIRALQLTGR